MRPQKLGVDLNRVDSDSLIRITPDANLQISQKPKSDLPKSLDWQPLVQLQRRFGSFSAQLHVISHGGGTKPLPLIKEEFDVLIPHQQRGFRFLRISIACSRPREIMSRFCRIWAEEGRIGVASAHVCQEYRWLKPETEKLIQAIMMLLLFVMQTVQFS